MGTRIVDMRKRDWDNLSLIATVGGAIVALHGITSRKWQEAHTFFLVLALAAAVGPQLADF